MIRRAQPHNPLHSRQPAVVEPVVVLQLRTAGVQTKENPSVKVHAVSG